MENQNAVGQVVSEMPPVKPKKRVNVWAIVLGVTTFAFAGAAVFFAIPYFMKDDVKVEQTESEVVVAEPEVVAETSMAMEYQEVRDIIEELTTGIESSRPGIDNGNMMAYKPNNLNTYISMRFDLEKRISNSNSNEANIAALRAKMEEAGFELLGTIPFFGSAGPEIFGYLNGERNIVCNMYADTEFALTDAIYNYVKLSCAKTDWTWLTGDEEKMIGELEDAYLAKTGEYPRTLYGYESGVKDSEVAPYQTLRVQIGGGYALFYRVDKNAEWQYFAGGQSHLPCSDYNTDDLKKAFAGNICYDEVTMGQITVQP